MSATVVASNSGERFHTFLSQFENQELPQPHDLQRFESVAPYLEPIKGQRAALIPA
jgi:hypothetical protein